MYEAGLTCMRCRHNYEPCIISGYPLRKGAVVNCRSCNRGGLKEYWNIYL